MRLGILMVLALAACVAAPTEADRAAGLEEARLAERPDEDAVKASLRRHLQDRYKDPEGAQIDIRDTLLLAGTGRPPHYGYGVCGMINARNGFGAYTGFVPFEAHVSPISGEVTYFGERGFAMRDDPCGEMRSRSVEAEALLTRGA